MSLQEYRKKRDFQRTAEPKGQPAAKQGALYLIQKHAASRLHYDFRLELGGVLKSWAVPKGPSLDPNVKVLAVHVEDHPIEYGSFEGTIPQGEYGGGTVMLWDRGTWGPEGDAQESYRKGKLVFELHGERLTGRWALIRMGGKAGDGGKNWLLKKLEDDDARPGKGSDLLSRMTTSIVSGRTMEEIADHSNASTASNDSVKRSKKPATTDKPDHKVGKQRTTRSLDPSSLDGARRAAMPAKVAPELPLLVKQIPKGEEWLHELKLDGYRMICFAKKRKVSLVTRRGIDWTDRFSAIAAAMEELARDEAIFDGEVAALKSDGTTDFQALQNMLRRGDDNHIVYFVFDLPYYRGYDLRRVPLIERKGLLFRLIGKPGKSKIIRYNDHIAGEGLAVFANACRHGLEGVVAKRADSHYVEGRTSDWVKVKCLKRQEFVIGGWTDPGGARPALGALLVGYYRKPGELVYCGRVGTGFTQQSLRDLHKMLRPLEQKQSPFHKAPTGVSSRGVIHWAKPKLVAEVAFAAWTADGMLRHASFQGIREDKEPREVTLELPVTEPPAAKDRAVKHTDENSTRRTKTPSQTTRANDQNGAADEFAGGRLTHPDRVLFPDEKITKRDLAAYYTSVAPFMLPHVVGRPLSLLRCPSGSTGPCFVQKHLGETMPKAVRGVAIKEKEGTGSYIVIDDLAGLISLVQLGALEIHPWGSKEDRIEWPDQLILDLDPAEDLAWADVAQAARHVKERLEDLELQSFVRTTGGKGLHVVVPIVRRTPWDELKALAKAFADALVREQPKRYIALSSKAKRPGKIFIDYLRNERGATAVASYSTRARSGATVATPISWTELSASLRPAQFNTRTVPERLQKLKQDPWHGFFDLRQSLTRVMQSQVKKW